MPLLTVEQVKSHFLGVQGYLDNQDKILISLMESGKIEAFGEVGKEVRFRSKRKDIVIEEGPQKRLS